MTIASFSQADADRISDKCGTDRAWLKVDDEGALTFDPSPDASYEACACVFQHVRDHLEIKVGFVGNEKAWPDE
jgi:hypothetical protein